MRKRRLASLILLTACYVILASCSKKEKPVQPAAAATAVPAAAQTAAPGDQEAAASSVAAPQSAQASKPAAPSTAAAPASAAPAEKAAPDSAEAPAPEPPPSAAAPAVEAAPAPVAAAVAEPPPPPPPPPAPPKPAFSDAASRASFEAALLSGSAVVAELRYDELESWATALEGARELDAAIARLSAAAEAKGAPPQVSFALAALYGRKGLVQRQYAMLNQAEQAAKARPDIVFALAAVYGRKDTLKASYSADELLVGTLRVESSPEGAAVLVDGVPRGSAPLSVDKLPEGPHRLRLELAGYDPWESGFHVETGLETRLSPKLGAKPGSIEVKTSPPSRLRLDGASLEDSPRVFEGLAPGQHRLAFSPGLFARRYYDGGEEMIVTVAPGERVSVNKSFPVARTRVRIEGAPAGSTLTLDGARVDASAFGEGVEIEAGQYDARVVSPAGQAWVSKQYFLATKSLYASKISAMTPVVPTRTVKLDGLTDSWGELLPISAGKGINFMGDPRFGVTGLYLCKDAKYLYWRVDFKEANPEVSPPKGIKDSIIAQLVFQMKDPLSLNIGIQWKRNDGSIYPYATVWNGKTSRGSDITNGAISYKMSKTMLVGRMALAPIAKYLVGSLPARMDISNEPDSSSHVPTPEREVVFSE